MPTFENNRIYREVPEGGLDRTSVLMEVLNDVQDSGPARSWVNSGGKSLRTVERLVKKFGASLADKTRIFLWHSAPKRNPLIFRLLRFCPELKDESFP